MPRQRQREQASSRKEAGKSCSWPSVAGMSPTTSVQPPQHKKRCNSALKADTRANTIDPDLLPAEPGHTRKLDVQHLPQRKPERKACGIMTQTALLIASHRSSATHFTQPVLAEVWLSNSLRPSTAVARLRGVLPWCCPPECC